jgi:hypothetical protein
MTSLEAVNQRKTDNALTKRNKWSGQTIIEQQKPEVNKGASEWSAVGGLLVTPVVLNLLTTSVGKSSIKKEPVYDDHSEAPLFTSGFCCSIIVCPLHLFLLVSALSVFLWFTASNHPFGLLFLIWCLNTCNWWIFLVDFFLVAFVYTNTLNWNWRALLWVFAWLIDWCQNM